MDMAVTLSTLRSKWQIQVKYTVCQYNDLLLTVLDQSFENLS